MKEFFTVIKVGLLNLKKYGIRDTARKSIGWLSCRNKSAIVEKVMPQHINCIQDFVSAIESCGGYVKGKDLENFSPFCLLISHELNHTGAPIALFNMALALKDEGYAPIFISINDGDFAIDIASQGITVAYIPFKQLSQLLILSYKLFSFVVINTAVLGSFVGLLSGKKVPVIWWIHESKSNYPSQVLSNMPAKVENNVHILCVGRYAKEMLTANRPDYIVDELIYSLPIFNLKEGVPLQKIIENKGKKAVLICGTIEQRKGYGIAIEAFKLLKESTRRNLFFVFIGRNCYEYDFKKIQSFIKLNEENSVYVDYLSREQMFSLYEQIDYLVCPSLDDPLPIVVAEALQSKKIVICSENTGYKSLLPQYNAGFIYKNNNPKELSKIIEYVYKEDDNLDYIRNNAEILYKEIFSELSFRKNISKILNKLVYFVPSDYDYFNGMISIVIPVYNGFNDLKFLIPKLLRQTKIKEIQIIIIDSGSNDDSIQYAKKNGCYVYSIPHEEFSHSYARNLGCLKSDGVFIMFMTQDAVPTDTLWLRKMVDPLLKNELIVASSCRQSPRIDSDLYAAYNINLHNNFMGINYVDRISHLPNNKKDVQFLRQNAQLDDVSCIVRKDIFQQYMYRGKYAEDLDLGIRLLNDGYSLIMRATVQVIHSHNRSLLYHFKRSIVDKITLNYFFPSSGFHQNDKDVIDNILSLYFYVNILLHNILKLNDLSVSTFDSSYRIAEDASLRMFKEESFSKTTLINSISTLVTDKEFVDYISILIDSYSLHNKNMGLISDFNYQVENLMIPFIKNYRFKKGFTDEIMSCFLKIFASMSGGLIGDYLSFNLDKVVCNPILKDIYVKACKDI